MLLQPLPALTDNLIWILRAGPGAPALVVDPGEAGPVLAAGDEGLEPVAILLTHHHPDHVAGVAALRQRWPMVQVIAPVEDRIAHADIRVAEGDQFEAAGVPLRVIEIPGHTRTHIAFIAEGADAPVVFSGDTLFSLGCGRMFEGTPTQMHASLQRLSALPEATRVCCGHEYTLANARFALTVDPLNADLQAHRQRAQDEVDAGRCSLPSTIGHERAANPFLRLESTAVRVAVAARLGRQPVDAVESFAVLRAWKDGVA